MAQEHRCNRGMLIVITPLSRRLGRRFELPLSCRCRTHAHVVAAAMQEEAFLEQQSTASRRAPVVSTLKDDELFVLDAVCASARQHDSRPHHMDLSPTACQLHLLPRAATAGSRCISSTGISTQAAAWRGKATARSTHTRQLEAWDHASAIRPQAQAKGRGPAAPRQQHSSSSSSSSSSSASRCIGCSGAAWQSRAQAQAWCGGVSAGQQLPVGGISTPSLICHSHSLFFDVFNHSLTHSRTRTCTHACTPVGMT
jgi:hypothetical protein